MGATVAEAVGDTVGIEPDPARRGVRKIHSKTSHLRETTALGRFREPAGAEARTGDMEPAEHARTVIPSGAMSRSHTKIG